MIITAQKVGFTKLATASDYANLIEGGLAAADVKIKQNPEKTFRFIRATLKGLDYFVRKREPAIKYMTEALRLKDRELINAIYDIQSKLVLRDGFTDDQVLQAMIDSMKNTTKVQREIKVSDVFDLSFVKKAHEELKNSGWKP
jgi:ABC-type nitrate/sulfonate/bicarbonate transport system substrate-binding protein